MDELGRMIAEADIARLITRYAALNDAGDFDAIAATYIEDGVFVRPSGGEPVTGRAAILASLKARPPRVSRHLISNIVVDLAGPDAATARSLMLLYTAPAGSLPTAADAPALLGGFDDRLVRTAEGWRFAERRGFVDLTIGGR